MFALPCALIFPLTASASGTPDQQITAGDNGLESSFGGSTLDAQTFTAGLSGTLTEVDVYILGPAEPLTVKIEGVNGNGTPNDSDVLTTTTVPGADIKGGWLAVALSTPSVKGDHYAIVLASPDNPGNEGTAWYLSATSYSGGGDWFNEGSGWNSLSEFAPNFLFKTYVTTPPVATATTVASASVDYSSSNSSVALTATVSSSQTVTEGSVAFDVTNSQGTLVGTVATANVTNGSATATYSLPAGTLPGDYTIKATYTDTVDAVANFSASTGEGTLQVIDNLPPTTTASFGGYTPGTWTNQSVQVTLGAVDNPNPGGSGVAATYYAIDNAACQATASGLANCTVYGGPLTISAQGSHTLTYFSVDEAGNIEAANSASVMIDTTAPTTTATLSPNAASSGWYNASTGAPTVSLSAVDNSGGSGVAATYYAVDDATCQATASGLASCTKYATPFTVAAQGTHSLTFFSVDNAGNIEAANSATIKVDTVPPSITAAVTPANPASSGWYNASTGAPTVSFTCSDAVSGIPTGTCPAAYTFPQGANQSHTASVTDTAGNSSSATVSGINVDLTAPTVTYTGNAGTYTVDQQVSITCTASDQLSGVASTTCQNISGPAYSFGLGQHGYSATATDKAGNTGSGSTSFTVTVTSTSLQHLINQFSTDPGVAASLDADVTQIANASNANAKAGALQGFTHLVQAQTGKSLTSAQAKTLITLADAL
jgi:hypothetical protein